MEYFETIEARQSCRSYDPDRPIEPEKLTQCLEAARIAPSACNSQPWHYYLATEPETVRKFAKCLQDAGMNRWCDRCTAFAAVTEEGANLSATVGGHIKDQQFAQIDIGISVAQFVLAATDLGVGSCIIGWFNEEKLRTLLGISAGKRIRVVVALGYPADDRKRARKRKPAADVITIH